MKDVCSNGHRMEGENLREKVVRGSRTRCCRSCQRDYNRVSTRRVRALRRGTVLTVQVKVTGERDIEKRTLEFRKSPRDATPKGPHEHACITCKGRWECERTDCDGLPANCDACFERVCR